MSTDTLPPPIFSITSFVSLLAVASLLGAAYSVSARVLPTSTPGKLRFLYIWHLFDALVHFTLEGSYLYNCFYSFTALPGPNDPPLPALIADSMTPANVFFLQQEKRLYGAFYGVSPTARLWQEYAKADKRWGGSDLTVISLELLTVFVMAPLALWVCRCIARGEYSRAWFWMMVIATGELYGGVWTVLNASSVLWVTRITKCIGERLLTLHAYGRVYDLCTGVAHRLAESGYLKLHVSLGLPLLLQYVMGLDTTLDSVRSLWCFRPCCHYFIRLRCATGDEEATVKDSGAVAFRPTCWRFCLSTSLTSELNFRT